MTDQNIFNITMAFGGVMFLIGTLGLWEFAIGILVGVIVANIQYWRERRAERNRRMRF